MTSNIGSQEILEAQQHGQACEELQAIVSNEVRQHFRPEFLNRVDETVVFHTLAENELGRIVEMQLGRLKARLEERSITLHITSEALMDLGARGYDPMYGARPLKRLIQHDVETPLSKLLIKGEVKDGDEVVVDYKDEKIVLVPTVGI